MKRDYQQKLMQLLPPVSYDKNTAGVTTAMAFDAKALTDADFSATTVVDVLNPSTSRNSLSEWEKVYGLHEKHKSYTTRVARTLEKIAASGGLSRAYFIAIAKAAGLTITIDEPQPFRAGFSVAGDVLWPHDAIWLWLVNIIEGDFNKQYFHAGRATAGERLLIFVNNDVFESFQVLKPAHTRCIFLDKRKKHENT